MRRLDQKISKGRYALIDEQITAGLTSATDIAQKIKNGESFKGLQMAGIINFCWKYLKNKGINIARVTPDERYALIDEQIAAGLTSATEITAKLKDTDPFKNLRYGSVRALCHYRLKEMGVKIVKQNAVTNYHKPNKKNTLEQRHALIDEQIAAGLTSPTEISDKIKDTEAFQGITYSTVQHFCFFYLKRKGVKSNKKDMINQRQVLIDEQIAVGMTSATKIAEKLKDTESFQEVRFNTVVQNCWTRLKEKGVKTGRQKMATKSRAQNKKNLVPYGVESSSELSKKINDLEAQLTELRSHKCSDAENELKNENQELRTENRQLKNRIEALSRSTKPSVVARPGFGG